MEKMFIEKIKMRYIKIRNESLVNYEQALVFGKFLYYLCRINIILQSFVLKFERNYRKEDL